MFLAPLIFVVPSFEKDGSVKEGLCHSVELSRHARNGGENFAWEVVDLRPVHPPLVFVEDTLVMGEDLVPDLVGDGYHLGELGNVHQDICLEFV